MVQFGIPAEEFALRATLPRVPDVVVKAERVVATDADHVMPFLWAAGEELDAFEAALDQDPTVANEECISKHENGRFYQMHWVEDIKLLLHCLTYEESVVLNAEGHADYWHLRVLFPDGDTFTQVSQFCEERDFTFKIEKIHERTEPHNYGQFGLTQGQYETLLTALDRGYYEVPREVSVRELAEELDVSHPALSERLRRAHRTLITNTIASEATYLPMLEEE